MRRVPKAASAPRPAGATSKRPYTAHKTSVINTKNIGAGTRIMAGAVIGEAVRIGKNSIIGSNVVLDNCDIGDNVIIKPGTCIGQDGFGFTPTPEGNRKKPQPLRVIIEDDVEVGANSCIDRGSWRDTIIRKGTKIDNMVQVGHNVQIGPHCLIAAQCGIAGSATLGERVHMGGQAGVKDHVSLGDRVRIAARSAVLSSVPSGEEWGGYPAIPLAQWRKHTALMRRALQPIHSKT